MLIKQTKNVEGPPKKLGISGRVTNLLVIKQAKKGEEEGDSPQIKAINWGGKKAQPKS